MRASHRKRDSREALVRRVLDRSSGGRISIYCARCIQINMLTGFVSAVLRDGLGNFQQYCGVLMLSSKIGLLMYRTFAFQSGESARQQRLTPVLPSVLLWSNRRADHLSKNDSRDDPPARWGLWKDPRGFASPKARPSTAPLAGRAHHKTISSEGAT
jgi:hypothetical protein